MSKPTRYPLWAENDTTETRSGKNLPNKVITPDNFVNNGTLDGLVPLQVLNDTLSLSGKWIRHFDKISQETVAKIGFNNNSLETQITVAGQNESIATNDPYQISNLQRFLLQDICTFDNATDTINTTFSHGLVNNDRVFFNTYTGTLPAELDNVTEYYVVNATATSFQVSLTQGGGAIDFTNNGTGTNYYRHNTGVSELGHVIYTGLEPANLYISGWVSLFGTRSANDSVRGVVMKIDINGNIVEDQVGARVTVDNTDPQSSQLTDIEGTLELGILSGEGTVVNIRNDDAPRNIIAQEILLTIIKA